MRRVFAAAIALLSTAVAGTGGCEELAKPRGRFPDFSLGPAWASERLDSAWTLRSGMVHATVDTPRFFIGRARFEPRIHLAAGRGEATLKEGGTIAYEGGHTLVEGGAGVLLNFCPNCRAFADADYTYGAMAASEVNERGGVRSRLDDFREHTVAVRAGYRLFDGRVAPSAGVRWSRAEADVSRMFEGHTERRRHEFDSTRLTAGLDVHLPGVLGHFEIGNGWNDWIFVSVRWRLDFDIAWDLDDGCKQDTDCAAGSVCETAVLGECDSKQRKCVPGCRKGQRPCDGTLQCVEATCKTCPCPDTCETPLCNDWGFEQGTHGGWTCLAGTFGSVNTVVNCPTSGSHQLLAGSSGVFNIPSVAPQGGTRAIRIGDLSPALPNAPGNAAAIQRTFTVTAQTAILRYMYALVLQVPTHAAAQQPYFRATATVGSTTVYDFRKVSSSSDPFFTDAGNFTLVRRWSCGVVDLTPYIGQSVTVRFEVSDCLPGGHFGYAYFDVACEPAGVQLTVPETMCEGSPLPASGTGPAGVTDHFWSVERSDAQGSRNPAEEVQAWFPGSIAPRDVAAFAASGGKPMVCGYYYRVKLAVRTECEPWFEDVKLVYVHCLAKTAAGPDHRICATHPVPVTLGDPFVVPGVAYQWTANGAVVGTSNQLTVMPDVGTAYTLTGTDTVTGCATVTTSTVTVVPDFKPQISVCYCPPATHLTASLPGYVGPPPTYSWSNGATGASIRVQPSVPTTYGVTATTGCDTHSASIALEGTPERTLIAPNVLAPFSPIAKNNRFRIYHLGMDEGQKPAYGATTWQFTVYDRWGGVIYTAADAVSACDALGNAEIPAWDGVANVSDDPHNIIKGKVVPIGEYTYTFELMDCQDHGGLVKVNGETRPALTVIW